MVFHLMLGGGQALFLGLAAWAALCRGALAAAPATATSSAALLEALEAAASAEEARRLLEPHLDDLKSLDPQVVERIVLRQWWDLARDVVAKSHIQQVDLSFSVRKAVRTLKDEADELLRTLNPKYGTAQQVSPSFQWAQNDTSIFLTIKYTVRWNSPGALEVTEPAVIMSGNTFNFTGLGKHSNNKYRYVLSLTLFDNIYDLPWSSWNAASVGKLSVTLKKKWARKWPRLLANKKMKISNMHVWMEMQEKLDGTLSGMTAASNSPVTCAATEKLYCLATDSCKKAANCTQCPGKHVAQEELHVCTGMPSEKAGLSFKDEDMDEGEIGGDVKITKAKNEFDIDAYLIYFGKDERSKLDPPLQSHLGETTPTGGDTSLTIPHHTRIPETATHLLVFSKNDHGEYPVAGFVALKDAVLPKAKPTSVSFTDEDGEKGEISGTVVIQPAENEDRIENYVLHWGKSATRKQIISGSYIRDVKPKGRKEVTHYIAHSTKIPNGTTHILVYSKNEFGEHPQPAAVKIVDNVKPCLAEADVDCPRGITISADGDPDAQQVQAIVTVDRAAQEENVMSYVLYWGRQKCTSEGGQMGAKNAHLKDLPVDGPMSFELPMDSPVPEGTKYVLAFTKNKVGESDYCVSAEFQDLGAGKGEL